MKNLSFASILVLILSFAALAQTNATLPCPTISVTDVSGLPIPNEPIIYTATVGKEVENYNVKYKWTVVNGEIIERQGNLTVKVLHSNAAKGLTVKFEAVGLPKGCSNIASETMHIDFAPQASIIGELLTPTSQIEKTELFEKLSALDDDPNAQLYIIFRYKKNTSQKIIKRTEQNLFDSLIKAGIPKDRITFVKDSATDESIRFWIVPAGAENPRINN
jgi:hypothetical protein